MTTYAGRHIWVADTGVFQLPLYRLSGLYAPANGEVSTALFALPTAGIDGLWLNAAAGWKGGLVSGYTGVGCVERVDGWTCGRAEVWTSTRVDG